MTDEHIHDYNTPIDVFDDDGVTHHRVLECECGEQLTEVLEEAKAPKPERATATRR